jgi:hypothetical protein
MVASERPACSPRAVGKISPGEGVGLQDGGRPPMATGRVGNGWAAPGRAEWNGGALAQALCVALSVVRYASRAHRSIRLRMLSPGARLAP